MSGVLLNPGERDVLPDNWLSSGHIEDGPAEAVWAHVILHPKQESRAVWRGQGPTQPTTFELELDEPSN